MSKRFKMQGGLILLLLSVGALLVFSRLPASAACNYSIIPASRTHGKGATNNTVGVNTTIGCVWGVVNTNTWITILSPTSFTNSGTVSYSVTNNPNLTPRTGVVMIANQVFTVRQSGINCAYSISPDNRPHGHGATTNTVDVMTDGVCSWTASTTDNWLTILSGASGMGDGVLTYSVGANGSFDDRTGSVMIAEEVFTVTQRGMPCMYGITPATRMHGFGAVSNTVILTASEGCAWTTTPLNNWISLPRSGIGSSNLSYYMEANPTTASRTGTVLIADQLLTLIQAASPGGPCDYDISPNGRMHGYGATSNYMTMKVSAGCLWTVHNTNTWITIVPDYGAVGTDDIGYTVGLNPSTKWRTGVVMVANQTFTVRQEGAPCTASIVPKSRSHGNGVASNYVRVPLPNECAWTVVNTNPWISIVPGYSGMGSWDVGYTVLTNPTMTARMGVVTIASQSFTVTQAATPCAYTLSPTGRTHGHGGTNNTITVTTSTNCSWVVQNNNTWIDIISGSSGTGTGTVSYAVDPNTSTEPRTGLVQIDGQTFTVNQTGFPCEIKLSPTNRIHGFSAATNDVNVIASSNCAWNVNNTNNWVTIYAGPNGAGATSLTYSVSANMSAADRTGMVTIGDQMLALTQRGTTNTIVFQTIITVSAGHVRVSLVGDPGVVWELQGSPDLQLWETISNITNTTGTVEYIDSVPAGSNRRFYRAILP